jgi:type VI secretion system protein ImpH
MTVNFMGLTGPTGVMPLVFTEFIIDRLRNKDHALREWLDIFNHRMISLFYKAWEKHKFPVPYEREGADAVSSYLKSFLGLGTPGLSDRQQVSDRSLVYYAGLLAHRPRSAVALEQLLADYFQVPVRVNQFSGSWYKLERAAQTKLIDTPLESARLGGGAVVGDEIWDLHAGVRLRFGPLTRAQYMEFLPGNPGHRALSALLKFYANEEYAFELQLVLQREETPACELGSDHSRLGWLTWATTAAMDRDPADTVLMM